MTSNWLEILKWIATTALIIGFGLFSAGIDFGWYIQIGGGLVWLIAAIIMKDKPLIATNGVMSAAGIIGRLLG
jgi:hypothetical protein